MLVFVATGEPLTYSVPVVPFSVTATCDQVLSGSRWFVQVICCSAPPPPVVIAKRRLLPFAATVRNMLKVVPVPKSNTRDQARFSVGFSQAETVKSDRELTMPSGRSTYSFEPHSLTALPRTPATRSPVAWQPLSVGALLTGPSAHSVVMIARLLSSAMPV